MAYRYNRINWQNKPNVATPISAENLNKMDRGIKDCDDAIGDLALLNTTNKTDLVAAVNELNNNLAKMPFTCTAISGYTIVSSNCFVQNKIAYIKFVFDTRTVEEKLIPYIGLLSGILGKIGTENHDYSDLANEINIYTGGVAFSSATFIQNGTKGEYVPKFIVKSKALIEKVPKLLELLEEILVRTKLDDKKRLKEIIQEMKSRLEMAIFDAGHIVAANRLFSYFSPVGRYEELISGLEFYEFVEELERNFDSKVNEIIEKIKTGLCEKFDATLRE